jgi:TetR/AcrR family transcriptional repressor of nem operon
MTKSDTREALIQAGTHIIAEQSFDTTGINAVLASAGVPKGSFYYHFPSKEDFGLAVIDRFAADYSQLLAGFLQDGQRTPLARIRRYLESGMAEMDAKACSGGCPIGNLGQELASRNEAFRARLDAVMRDWERQFAGCLADAREAGELGTDADAHQLARTLLSGWEGAILRAKLMKSVAPMQDFIALWFGRVLRP